MSRQEKLIEHLGGPLDKALSAGIDGRQSARALEIARGASRLLRELGFAMIPEFVLANGMRADLTGVAPDGTIVIVEVKSSLIDYRTDQKWRIYLDYADRFAFAVLPDFPREVFPDEVGLIVADRYGAEILRDFTTSKLPPARRKSMLIDFSRTAAYRLHDLADPAAAMPFGG